MAAAAGTHGGPRQRPVPASGRTGRIGRRDAPGPDGGVRWRRQFHEGGLPGLKPGEVAAVLQKGEEVLTADDPRHVGNGGGGGGGNTRIINAIDGASFLEEIGMLLMQDPHLLLVDEPVAGMTHQEMDRTAELLLSLEGKHSVVVVEHDMDFVRSIAKRVTVLHQGSVLAEGSMDEVQNDPRVVEVYLGE